MIANVAVAVIKMHALYDQQVLASKAALFKFLVPQKAALLAVRAGYRLSAATVGTVDVKIGATSLLSAAIDLFPIAAPAKPTVALIATGSGNLDAGVHKYKVTFESAYGETDPSAASTGVTNDSSNKQNTVTIPVGPAGTLYRHIYRTQQGGSTYTLLATISNNTTVTYVDNIADSTIVSNDPPPSVNRANDGVMQSGVLSDAAGVAMAKGSEVQVDVTLTGTSLDDLSVQLDYLPVE